ncbi:MAG TPA: universal stress protein [Solirubrobacteraceae bacterium]|nr:universal stress protein [Solirubrobacteraceae bacterium]
MSAQDWIVVGTDGSPGAGAVVRRSARLARATGAGVHLVSAYRTIAGTGRAPYAPAFAAERADAEEILREGAEFVRSEEVEVKTHAVPGDPADALIAVAESEGATLLVVGDRGMRRRRRLRISSVTDKVSHHAPCNLLILRTTEGPIVPRRHDRPESV